MLNIFEFIPIFLNVNFQTQTTKVCSNNNTNIYVIYNIDSGTTYATTSAAASGTAPDIELTDLNHPSRSNEQLTTNQPSN